MKAVDCTARENVLLYINIVNNHLLTIISFSPPHIYAFFTQDKDKFVQKLELYCFTCIAFGEWKRMEEQERVGMLWNVNGIQRWYRICRLVQR